MKQDSPDPNDLIFDWSAVGTHRFAVDHPVMVNDETLRDGLQSPSVRDPDIETKIRILHLMESLGIECASMGLPGAGPRQREAVLALCREIADRGLRLRPNCGGRTVRTDVEHILDIAQGSGSPVEACLFIGSSPIRQYVEQWDIDDLLRNTREAVSLAAREGLDVTYITEDTIRAAPAHLEILLTAAVEAGATRVCLCDTAGAAIPAGVRNLVEWTRQLLDRVRPEVGIDWHGHRDRDLGLANTLAAMEAGASRVHGTALGVGERVGNTSTESILVNLQLLGIGDRDLSRLDEFVATVATALAVDIPHMAPIVGRDAFRTAAGVHAAAIAKAQARGDAWLADRVYSGVPAGWLGRRQEIEVGPLSGTSNVVHFLQARGIEVRPDFVGAVLAAAKRSQRVLTETEIREILADVPGETA